MNYIGKEHQMDMYGERDFEVENSLLELGFENDSIMQNYKKAMATTPNNQKIDVLRNEIRHKIKADVLFF